MFTNRQSQKKAAVAPVEDSSWLTSSLRMVITGAEKAPQKLYDFAAKVHEPPFRLIEGYGITETSPVLTANIPTKDAAGVGWPISGIEIGLLNVEAYLTKRYDLIATAGSQGLTNGKANTEGLIVAKGDSVFGAPDATEPMAYLGLPLSKKNPFLHINGAHWYDTGDLGYFDESGALFLSGRLKRFVKIAGEMVSLVAMEAVLKRYEPEPGKTPWADVEEGPVLAVEALERDGRPVLALVSTVEASLQDANEQLAKEGMPRIAKLTQLVPGRCFGDRWARLGVLPLLGSGKTDYAAIKRAVEAAVSGSDVAVTDV
jgi:long-chain-fatty-acid--[acyl-carrier-protein] ligase